MSEFGLGQFDAKTVQRILERPRMKACQREDRTRRYLHLVIGRWAWLRLPT